MKSLPYEDSSSGEAALAELQRILSKFGCGTFGTMTDQDQGKTIVQFRHRDRNISLEASWKGYAVAWLKVHPYGSRTRGTKQQYEAKALEKGRIAVCSVLRDWVKGQITAVECGIMSFEAAFMPHMLLPNGERVIDVVQNKILKLPNSEGPSGSA